MLAAFTDALIRNNIYIKYFVFVIVILFILEIHCNFNIMFIALLQRTYMTEESYEKGRFKFYFMALAASTNA